jgi:hypothetical protein
MKVEEVMERNVIASTATANRRIVSAMLESKVSGLPEVSDGGIRSASRR